MSITKISPSVVDFDDGITISTADNDAQLILVSTDADANVSPLMQFYRNSGTPADNDQMGRIEFNGRNDNSQDVNYATIVSQILDASDGTEDGRFAINTMVAGTSQSRIDIRASETVINNESLDLDFRVESDANANMLFVDGGNSAIGVGTTPNSGWSGASTSGRVPIQIGAGSISGRLNDNHTEFSNNCYASGTGNDPQWSGMSRYAKQQIEFDANGNIIFKTAATVDQSTFDSSPNFTFSERMTIFLDGSVGLGTNWNGTKDSSFKVMADQSGWASVYHNDGNGSNRYGIKIGCGADNAAGTNYAMGFDNGDFTSNQGYITFSGGTVTYGAFTAHHPCVIPDADNDPDSSENAYPYGTLLETISLSYTQTEETDTERGIRYNVQKSSGAYSKKVLGAYGSSMNDAPHNPDNEHQALVLGDGHILCNNEKGNISVGDGICTSSTAGIGMKADKMAMIIGIAQEDVTFSGSETKLVAVQYGLQQFTPWTD